jgi:hypothetical protein
MRVIFFVTLRANNLPETRKRQYENETCALAGSIGRYEGRREIGIEIPAAIFPPNGMPRASRTRCNIA